MPTFAPVPVKTRAGWTAARQGVFIEALTDTGSVRMSTQAAGMAHTGVYRLRHMPGGESFARAWDAAVGIAARRVRDVLIDHAIHGIPERVTIGKNKVVERRRFNHRTMIWVLQHHMPDDYPGGSTTHRRGWEGRGREGRGWEGGGREGTGRTPRPDEAPPMSHDEAADAVTEKILRQLKGVHRTEMREIAADTGRRAAYDLLNGPQDWDAIDGYAPRSDAD